MSTDSSLRFRGFDVPRWTPVPDELFDEHLPDLSGAELKVLLYVIRRTYGFKKQQDAISISQMLHGITKADGTVLDRGTGLSKKTLLGAIRSLCDNGYIVTERRRSARHGDEATLYKLHVCEPGDESTDEPQARNGTTRGGKTTPGGGGQIPPRPRGQKSPTQDTVEQQTDKQDTDDSNLRGGKAANAWSKGAIGNDDGVGERLPNGYTKEEDVIAQFLEDFSRELGDGEHTRSNVRQAINIYRRCQTEFTNVDMAFYLDVLQASRELVRKRHVTKRRPDGHVNRMPYYFAAIRDYFGISDGPTLPESQQR